ncbi:MAG: hypothetical protein IEMM0006_1000 [bacterium]|nr:MAG: hypothetical protein IEMM0006_1000 [bacterium]
MIKKVKIFSRKHNPAFQQVKEILRCFKEITFETDFAEAYKDEIDDRLLTNGGLRHFFMQESFDVLLENRADIVLHSAKDLPYPLNDQLEIIALTDTLVSKNNGKPGERPFETHPLRGNLVVVAKRDNEPLKKLFRKIDIRKNFGRVHLAGFGPGDPELMTLKTNKVLSEADIIFYDDLLDSSCLKKYSGEEVYVGKRKGKHSKDQDEINRMLYEAALKGLKVVRLKGGDAMIFGRGGEEISYLRQRFIDVEVIPGVTSAIAAAAESLIPLTHRGVASSVAFCTGHPENKIRIPDADTLVYYMGASSLKIIAEKLMRNGLSDDTPTAVIRNASLPSQQVLTTTLKKIVTDNIVAQSPSLIIVGDTIKVNNCVELADKVTNN